MTRHEDGRLTRFPKLSSKGEPHGELKIWSVRGKSYTEAKIKRAFGCVHVRGSDSQ